MQKLRGIFLLIIAASFFGIMPIWVKIAYSTGLNAYQVIFLRSGMAAIILAIIILYRRIDFHVERKQLGPLAIATFLGYTATILTLYLSYDYVSAGVATSLHYLYPVLVMLLTFFIFREKMQFYKWMVLLVSLAGICLIADFWGSDYSLQGVALAAGSAVFFAIYMLSINHPQLKQMNSLVMAFYACLMASGTSLILLVGLGDGPMMFTLKGFFYTFLVSVFCTALALDFFVKGTQIVGSANASILSTLEPVVSLIAGIIILHEPLTWYTTLGCGLIVAAVIMIGYADIKKGAKS